MAQLISINRLCRVDSVSDNSFVVGRISGGQIRVGVKFVAILSDLLFASTLLFPQHLLRSFFFFVLLFLQMTFVVDLFLSLMLLISHRLQFLNQRLFLGLQRINGFWLLIDLFVRDHRVSVFLVVAMMGRVVGVVLVVICGIDY